MCLIVAVEQSRNLPVHLLQTAIESAVALNPDGIGITYPDNGKAMIEKTIKGYSQIIDKALELYCTTADPFVLHLRYNTVGTNSNSNTHPFRISKSLAMVHNKTLGIDPPSLAWSDSRTVAELLRRLCKADTEFFGSPLFHSFIDHHAEMQNRFVFLDAELKSLTYINEHLGIFHDGVWFSNLYSWDPSTVGITKKTTKTKLYEQIESIEAFDDEEDYFRGAQWDSNDIPLGWGKYTPLSKQVMRDRS